MSAEKTDDEGFDRDVSAEKISVAIPCYRSEKSIGRVVEELAAEFGRRRAEYQIVLVNDGSPDGTFAVIKALAFQYPQVTAVNLTKNYGQHAARLAAIPYLDGDYIVYMDDDGQHPVSGIFPMLEKLKSGNYDVVYALFPQKQHGPLKRAASRVNTATLNFLAGKPRDIRNSSFSVMRGYLLKELAKYRSPFPSWTGFLMQLTRNIANVELAHCERISGKSNYTLKKMAQLYLNSMTGFSIVPLRIASVVGAVLAAAGFFAELYLIIRKFIKPGVPAGYTSLLVAVLLIGGILMMMLGLLGEYVGRIYMISSNLPQYTVREVVNERVEAEDDRLADAGKRRQT